MLNGKALIVTVPVCQIETFRYLITSDHLAYRFLCEKLVRVTETGLYKLLIRVFELFVTDQYPTFISRISDNIPTATTSQSGFLYSVFRHSAGYQFRKFQV
jgi:hypothetical protein